MMRLMFVPYGMYWMYTWAPLIVQMPGSQTELARPVIRRT